MQTEAHFKGEGAGYSAPPIFFFFNLNGAQTKTFRRFIFLFAAPPPGKILDPHLHANLEQGALPALVQVG